MNCTDGFDLLWISEMRILKDWSDVQEWNVNIDTSLVTDCVCCGCYWLYCVQKCEPDLLLFLCLTPIRVSLRVIYGVSVSQPSLLSASQCSLICLSVSYDCSVCHSLCVSVCLCLPVYVRVSPSPLSLSLSLSLSPVGGINAKSKAITFIVQPIQYSWQIYNSSRYVMLFFHAIYGCALYTSHILERES